MSKFNNVIDRKLTHEGGSAYSKDSLTEWLDFMFSSYLENQYYESDLAQMSRFVDATKAVIDEYGVEFAMKAVLFAHNEIGLRSVSHLAAAILNGYPSEYKRRFFRNLIKRPDEINEIFCAIDFLGGKRSHALIRGCADFLSNASAYQIGKYKMKDKAYNMYDIINLTHARSEAIDAYKAGTLELPDTWEVAISACRTPEQKKDEWMRLVEEHKLGYLALIRNLRNILNMNPPKLFVDAHIAPQIAETSAILNSNVMPYQIYNAFTQVRDFNYHSINRALECAFIRAMGNMPELDGDTCVILDVSGSMTCPISKNSNMTILQVASVYATCVMLACANSGSCCDIIKFATNAGFAKIFVKSPFETIEKMCNQEWNRDYGCGTQIHEALAKMGGRKYDRVFVFSDLQVCDNVDVSGALDEAGASALYSFDLGSYRDVSVKPSDERVHFVTTVNETVFKFIEVLELGGDIKDYIEQTVTL